MTIKEAIFILSNDFEVRGLHKKALEAVDLAVDAIEKQAPTKLDKIRNEFFDINGEWDSLCPVCKKDLTPTYRLGYRPQYCDRCGKALDWTE